MGVPTDLETVLERLGALVNWEKRERSPGSQGGGMRVDVEPARDLLRRLGDPQKDLRVVHVAGTKGKGSVAALVEAGLGAAGLAVGRFASPHVERLNERISIHGAPIDDDALAAALTAALDAHDARTDGSESASMASWFDVLTAAAAFAFRAAGLEWAVVECGLGGRLDSTNALDGEVCVVTNIDLEHTKILGDTRPKIAAEKAGIFVPGATVVTGLEPGDEAGEVVAEKARALDLEVRWLAPATRTIDEENAELARLVLGALGDRGVVGPRAAVGPEILGSAECSAARLPGRLERFEVSGVTVVLDGAHVASSLERVLRDLEGVSGAFSVAIVGTGADKDRTALLKVLCGRADRVLCTSVGAGPVASPQDLADEAERLGLAAETAVSPSAALQRALELTNEGERVLVTGSLHLVGAIRPLLPSDHPC